MKRFFWFSAVVLFSVAHVSGVFGQTMPSMVSVPTYQSQPGYSVNPYGAADAYNNIAGNDENEERQKQFFDDPKLGEIVKEQKDLQKSVEQKSRELQELQQKLQNRNSATDQYFLEAAVKELAVLKPKQVPDGRSANLDFWTFPELDGSTSCQNLGMIAASYVLQVPYKWKAADRNRNYNYNNRPPLIRTFPPRPGENPPYNSYEGTPQIGTILQAVPDTEKAAFRQRNVLKTYFGQFQETHGAYRSLIGPPQNSEIPETDMASPSVISGIFNYPTTSSDFASLNTPNHNGQYAFPASEILLVARKPSADELTAAQLAGVELDVRPVALDAFVFVLNRQNPVRSLTLEQIRSIYASSSNKNWKEFGVGGAINMPVHVLERNRNSGSRELMDTLVVTPEALRKYAPDQYESNSSQPRSSTSRGNESFRDHRQTSDSSYGGMMGPFYALQNNANGIGYSVYHYEHFMFRVPETRLLAVDGVMPDYETVRTGKYPLVYEVYVVTRKGIAADSNAAKLRDWLLSADGQRCVRESGYVPVNPDIATE